MPEEERLQRSQESLLCGHRAGGSRLQGTGGCSRRWRKFRGAGRDVLASRSSGVRLVYRGHDLSDSMSQYLVERLRRSANVTIETSSQVVELSGNDRLRSVKIRDGDGHVARNGPLARSSSWSVRTPAPAGSKTPCGWTTTVSS